MNVWPPPETVCWGCVWEWFTGPVRLNWCTSSVSLQTNLWKYKSCEKDQLTPHVSVSPYVCVSSFHHSHPSFSQSIHQQQWCAVIIVRASKNLSVCLHARPRRVVIYLPMCVYILVFACVCVCVCTVYVCDVTNLHSEEPLWWSHQYVDVYHPVHMLGFKQEIFQ